MSERLSKSYYEPFKKADGNWYFWLPKFHGPSSTHPELEGHGDILVGPYKDESSCKRQAGVTQVACAGSALHPTAGEGET